jgi:hypothetical protein
MTLSGGGASGPTFRKPSDMIAETATNSARPGGRRRGMMVVQAVHSTGLSVVTSRKYTNIFGNVIFLTFVLRLEPLFSAPAARLVNATRRKKCPAGLTSQPAVALLVKVRIKRN